MIAFLTLSFLHAASFDCGKAQSPSELLICSNSALSQLDEQLASTYKSTKAQLSKSAQEHVLSTQKEWLKSWPVSCAEDGQIALDCAVGSYKNRIEELTVDSTFLGSYSKYTVHHAYAVSVNDPDAFISYASEDVVYPQIDNASNDVKIAAWNSWMQAPSDLLSKNPSDSNESHTMVFSPVSENIHLRTYSVESMGHGAAHPNGSVSFSYFRWDTGKVLNLNDVLKGDWMNPISAFVFQNLQKNLEDMMDISSAAELGPFLKDIGHWNFSKNGVQIWFNAYDIAPYVVGPQEVTIPWSEFSPYLTDFAKKELGQ